MRPPKKYRVTLEVDRQEYQDHPRDWYWHDLLDCNVQLIEVAKVHPPQEPDNRQLSLFPELERL